MAVQTHISHWRLQDTTYHYRCPRCREWLTCAWSKRPEPRSCRVCELHHVATSPMFDPSAWVETREPPYEMARAAFVLHAHVVDGVRTCTAPGCEREAHVLAHHIPIESGGRTCVDNLFPVCTEHDRTSGLRLLVEK